MIKIRGEQITSLLTIQEHMSSKPVDLEQQYNIVSISEAISNSKKKMTEELRLSSLRAIDHLDLILKSTGTSLSSSIDLTVLKAELVNAESNYIELLNAQPSKNLEYRIEGLLREPYKSDVNFQEILLLAREYQSITSKHPTTSQYRPERYAIGMTIRNVLSQIGQNKAPSLSKLADITKITRTTLYRWKDEPNMYAFKDKLLQLISMPQDNNPFSGLKLHFNMRNVKVELIPSDKIGQGKITLTEIKTEELSMGTQNLDSAVLVNALVENNNQLIEDKKELKQTIKVLREEIKNSNDSLRKLDQTIQNLSRKNININLDHSRMQFVVNMEKQTFMNCTQLYADLYNTDAFDIIKTYVWSDVVHKDDIWRFELIPLQTKEQMEAPQVWKVQGKDGIVYIETVTLSLDDEGSYKKVDAKLSTNEDWEKTNQNYKSLTKD